MPVPLQLLLLEDQQADAELVLHNFAQAGFAPDWRRVETEANYLAALDPSLDPDPGRLRAAAVRRPTRARIAARARAEYPVHHCVGHARRGYRGWRSSAARPTT